MSNPVFGDLLSAATLLATILALFYSTWYGEIKDARNTRIALHDNTEAIKAVCTVLRFRASPLCATALLLDLLLASPCYKILHQTLLNVFDGHGRHFQYNPVQACFIGVFIVIVLLTVLTTSAVIDLISVLKKLRNAG